MHVLFFLYIYKKEKNKANLIYSYNILGYLYFFYIPDHVARDASFQT